MLSTGLACWLQPRDDAVIDGRQERAYATRDIHERAAGVRQVEPKPDRVGLGQHTSYAADRRQLVGRERSEERGWDRGRRLKTP